MKGWNACVGVCKNSCSYPSEMKIIRSDIYGFGSSPKHDDHEKGGYKANRICRDCHLPTIQHPFLVLLLRKLRLAEELQRSIVVFDGRNLWHKSQGNVHTQGLFMDDVHASLTVLDDNEVGKVQEGHLDISWERIGG